MPGRYTVEVQAEVRNGLLRGGPVWRCLSAVSGYHAEIFREDGGLPSLIVVQVVGDATAIYELE